MRVTHFSGRGVGKGTKADIRKQQKDHPPTSPADDFDQLLFPLTPLESPDELGSLVPGALAEEWSKGLEKLLQAALQDETRLEPALAEFLKFIDKVKMYGLEQDETLSFDISTGWDYLGKGVARAVDKAYTVCVNQKDPAQASNIWRWISWAEKWPEMKASIGPVALAKMREKAQKCLSFELDFDAVINMKITGAYAVDAHLHAVVPIHIQPDGSALAGQAPLEIISYQAYLSDDLGSDCMVSISKPTATQFQVVLGLYNPNLMVGRNPDRIDPVLKYSLGKLIESLSIVCPGFSSPTTWGIRGGYQFLHADEMGKSSSAGIAMEDPIEARIWNSKPGQWIKTYNRPAVDLLGVGTIGENTTLTLKHTPEK
jgi:hypothetical protein